MESKVLYALAPLGICENGGSYLSSQKEAGQCSQLVCMARSLTKQMIVLNIVLHVS